MTYTNAPVLDPTERGDRGNVGIIRSPIRASILPDKLGLSFVRTKELDGINRETSDRFAATARLPGEGVWTAIQDTAETTVGAWDALAEKGMLPKEMVQKVSGHLEKVASAILHAKSVPTLG